MKWETRRIIQEIDDINATLFVYDMMEDLDSVDEEEYEKLVDRRTALENKLKGKKDY